MNGQDSVASDQASLLFGALFGNYFEAHDGYIALAWRKPGDNRFHNEFYSDIHFAANRAEDLREQKVDTFFAVAPHNRPNRRKTSIRNVLTLHIDADGKDKSVERKIKHLKPSVIVRSGSKFCFHPYFFLDAPIPTPQNTKLIEELNKRLAIHVGIDPQSTFDTSRILRVPGTFNLKNPKQPRLVEIVEFEPKVRYPLDHFVERFGARITDFQETDEQTEYSDRRGHFLNPDDRAYVDKLLRVGLFETKSRNHSMLLLIRNCYEQGMDQRETVCYVMNFFQERHNNLSKDWLSNPDYCAQKIEYAVGNWWRKAHRIKHRTDPLRLSSFDFQYIESLDLERGDKKFIKDALMFFLNHKQGDSVVLSARQFRKLRMVTSSNEREKLKLLQELRIVELTNKARPQNRLAREYKVLYRFRTGDIQEGQQNDLCDLEEDVSDRIDALVLSGYSTAEIRQRIPSASRQRVFYRRRRLDEIASRDQFLDG